MPPTGGASTPAPRVSDEDGARAAVRAAYPSAGFAPGCAADATGKTCITTNWTADTLRGGIGCVSLASAESAVLHCFARKADGTWTYWVTIANGGGGPVRALPGDAIVCANGDGLNLRAEPSTTAQKITLLPDGSTVHLDEFVLTEPGPFSGDPRQHGDGWYHVATPQQGWAYDRFLVPASDGGCRRNWWP